MPSIRILEAYYGADVVLDFSDDASRDAAFRLALRTVAAHAPAGASFRIDYSAGFPGLAPPSRRALSFEEAVAILKSIVTRENRYLQVTCGATGERPFRFGVLDEDGSCLTLGPTWVAPKEWYDSFWATLWSAFETLEGEIPGLILESAGGVRRCLKGHRISPFQDNCQVCGGPPGDPAASSE